MPLVSKAFSDIITFTRASTATYFDSAGVLQSAAIDAPRLDYDPSTLAAQGLLIEEARTNFFTNAANVFSGSIGTGTVSGPDNVNCRTFIPTAGAVAFPNITGPSQTFSLSPGQTVDWAWSGWVAAGPVGTLTLEPRIVLNISVGGSTSFIYAEFQINTSSWTVRTKVLPAQITEVSAPTITLFKPGLYRVTWVVRFTQDATGRNNISASIQARDTAGNGTYTADGVSGFQYTLCQAETGSFPTSTIPTTTTALTRAADVASVNTLSPWFNSVEGTLYAQASVISTSYNQGVLADIGAVGAFGTTEYLNWNGSGWTLSPNTAPINVTSVVTTSSTAKMAAAIKANDSVISANGLIGVVDTACAVPLAPTTLSIGKAGWSAASNFFNGWIQRITYYPRRLSNAELQAITA
jgi:hypothetical protein